MRAIKLHLSKLVRLIAIAFLVFGFCRDSVSAQPLQTGKVSFAKILQVETGGIEIDPEELGEFVDQLVTARMLASGIPGYTVSVVQDGRLIFAKGYGYADLEKKVQVNADQTLFRIGSVSKLFVWTAVMQLVERNLVDLNVDVNRYLDDFHIPETFPQPITLAHLLTHTSGFDKRDQGELAQNLDQAVLSLDYIQNELPERVFPPGQFHLYSNYGANLAAYIVQQVSGIPFNAYIEQNILQPLRMNRSTYSQPLPTNLAGDMAVGYYWMTGIQQGKPGEFEGFISPVLTSTATDMAKFMLAHLGNGMESQTILQRETLALMHAPQFGFDPRLPGYTFGFFEIFRNGQRLISHAGATLQFSANLMLIPEQNIGLFEAYSGGIPGSGFLVEDFIDHYFPPEEQEVRQPVSFSSPSVEAFHGIYRTTRMSQTTFEKVIVLLDSGKKVIANEDGSLTFHRSRWIRIEPFAFQKEGERELLLFQTQNASLTGEIIYLLIGNEAYQKVPWFGTQTFQIALLSTCVIIFLWAALALPFAFHLKRKNALHTGLTQRIGLWMSWGISVANLAFITIFANLVYFGNCLFTGFSFIQKGIFLLPVLSILLIIISTGMMVLDSTKARSAQSWNYSARVYALLVAVSGVAFSGWLNYWNLLGFRF